jgi:hypothetical protein
MNNARHQTTDYIKQRRERGNKESVIEEGSFSLERTKAVLCE